MSPIARRVHFLANPVSRMATIDEEVGEGQYHVAADEMIQVQTELSTAGSGPSPSENLKTDQPKKTGARNTFSRVGVKLGFGEHSKISKSSTIHVQTRHKHRPS